MSKDIAADIAVIGAGLVGAAVAFTLKRSGFDVVVLESAGEPCAEVSRSNSGVLHTGFDAKPDSLEAALIGVQRRIWQPIFDALEIPYRVVGAIVVAGNDEDLAMLSSIESNARNNGVPVSLLTQNDVHELEPNVSAKAGLLVQGEAITDPFEVVSRMLAAGSRVYTHSRVERLSEQKGGVVAEGPTIKARVKVAINCAGLHADELDADHSFSITPRRGDFLAYGSNSDGLVRHILLPVPTPRTKGILVFPTLYGRLCAGPSAVEQQDKDLWNPDPSCLAAIRGIAEHRVPRLASLTPVEAWAGLRPVATPDRYIIQWSNNLEGLLNVAGIRSTGLSSCLGVAWYVMGMLSAAGFAAKQSALEPRAASATTHPAIPWWQRHNAIHAIDGRAFVPLQ